MVPDKMAPDKIVPVKMAPDRMVPSDLLTLWALFEGLVNCYAEAVFNTHEIYLLMYLRYFIYI